MYREKKTQESFLKHVLSLQIALSNMCIEG